MVSRFEQTMQSPVVGSQATHYGSHARHWSGLGVVSVQWVPTGQTTQALSIKKRPLLEVSHVRQPLEVKSEQVRQVEWQVTIGSMFATMGMYQPLAVCYLIVKNNFVPFK